MKKLLALGLVFVLLAFALCACGASEEEFKCGMCQKTVTEVPNEVEYLGVETKVCESCNEGLEAAQDALEGLEDELGDLL